MEILSNGESELESNESALKPSDDFPDTHVAVKVSDKESIYTLAEEYGLLWKTIWNDPLNKTLKRKRLEPHALVGGDIVAVKKPEKKLESCAEKARHRFRRIGVPKYVSMQIKKVGEPQPNKPYKFNVDGKITEGVLDSNGCFKEKVPLKARSAVLTVGEGAFADHYELNLAGLNPLKTFTGIKQRLKNLGYLDGYKQTDDVVRSAISRFQRDHGLEITGVADSAFLENLKRDHGS